MATLQDKSINNGGRVDAISKFMGGMSFRDNAQATVVGAQNAWVAIGTGAIGATLYTTIVPVTVNPQFSISGVTTDAQKLVFNGGKPGSYVNVRFGVTVFIPGGGTISNIEYRLRRTDAASATTTVATGSTSASVLAFNFPSEFSTVAAIEPGDQFFLEIRNLTANQNIRVADSHIVISQ